MEQAVVTTTRVVIKRIEVPVPEPHQEVLVLALSYFSLSFLKKYVTCIKHVRRLRMDSEKI